MRTALASDAQVLGATHTSPWVTPRYRGCIRSSASGRPLNGTPQGIVLRLSPSPSTLLPPPPKPNSGNWPLPELPLDMHRAAQVNGHWKRVTLNRHGLWTPIAILALAHAPANTVAILAPGLGMAMASLNPAGPVLLPDVSITTGPCYLVGNPGMSRDAALMLRQTVDAAVQMIRYVARPRSSNSA